LYDDLNQDYNFRILPGFVTPDWSKSCVIYQIYVDRFFNGDKSNDVLDNEYCYLNNKSRKISDWNAQINQNDICNFYGGDLQGVINKLDYLKELGVEVIYFNPLFVSPSNHKYDTQDYDYIDPHIGKIINDSGNVLSQENFDNKFATKYITRTTDKKNLEASNKLFIDLISIMHKKNIKVILDGVFNHCGAWNKWFDREDIYNQANYPVGAYLDNKSIYRDYFIWYEDNCYESWWGFNNHPKLNYENSDALFKYILKLAAKWVSPPFNADGWRLDVAADLGSSQEFNHKFWCEFRKAVKNANSNAIIIAEHYGSPKSWLEGDQWDSVMNYDAFMEPITWFLTGMEKHSEEFYPERLSNAIFFENTMRYNMAQFNFQSLYSAMNELSNHDHSRFLTRTNKTIGRLNTRGAAAASENINKNIMAMAVVFQMTWPGCPTIYYGDEVGLTGWSDPDNRRTFPWDNQDKELLELHKALIKIHKASLEIKYGSLEYLLLDFGVISFGRMLNKNKTIVILNNNDTEYKISVPVWKININKKDIIIKIFSSGFDKEKLFDKKQEIICESNNGFVDLKLNPKSSIILQNRYMNLV
jgi:alpha-glucosidase